MGKHIDVNIDFCSEENKVVIKTLKNFILMNKESIFQNFKDSCDKNTYYGPQYCIDEGLRYHETLIENIVNDSEFSSKICPFGNSLLDYADSGEDCGTCGNLMESMDNFANWVIKKAEGDAFCNNYDYEPCKEIVGYLLKSWYHYLGNSHKCLRICPNDDKNDYEYPEDSVDGNGIDNEYYFINEFLKDASFLSNKLAILFTLNAKHQSFKLNFFSFLVHFW